MSEILLFDTLLVVADHMTYGRGRPGRSNVLDQFGRITRLPRGFKTRCRSLNARMGVAICSRQWLERMISYVWSGIPLNSVASQMYILPRGLPVWRWKVSP